MSHSYSSSDQIRGKLRSAGEAFEAEYHLLLPVWQFTPWNVGVRGKVHSGYITFVYVVFNIGSLLGVVSVSIAADALVLGVKLSPPVTQDSATLLTMLPSSAANDLTDKAAA